MKYVEIRLKLLTPEETARLPKLREPQHEEVLRYLQEVEDTVNAAFEQYLNDFMAYGVATLPHCIANPKGEGPLTATVTAAEVIEAMSPQTAGATGVAPSARNAGEGSLGQGHESPGTSNVDQPSLGTRCGPRPDPDTLSASCESSPPPRGTADLLAQQANSAATDPASMLIELNHIASKYAQVCEDPDYRRLLESIIGWADAGSPANAGTGPNYLVRDASPLRPFTRFIRKLEPGEAYTNHPWGDGVLITHPDRLPLWGRFVDGSWVETEFTM